MGEVGNAVSSGMSWLMDDVLGIDVDDSGPIDTTQQAAAVDTSATQGATQQAAQANQAVSTIDPPPPPPLQNIINVGTGGMEAAKAEAAKTAQAPPPPAFGSAPGRKATRTKSPGGASTFLGASALPARRAAAGGFGFDKQSSGSKTLIGT